MRRVLLGMTQPARAHEPVADRRVPTEAAATPLERLRKFLDTHGMTGKTGPRAFAEFERELHERLMMFEREIIGAEMAAQDVDAPAVVIEGKVHRRVLRQSQTYLPTAAGKVVVERTLYKDRTDDDGRCVRPMELLLGAVGDFWTPRAAQQVLWVVSQMTPKKAEELFERLGNMQPSKSSIGRLPKLLSERWEGRSHRRDPHGACAGGEEVHAEGNADGGGTRDRGEAAGSEAREGGRRRHR
jgi:hypothetical protein